jgi:hypothetical protein
LSRTNALPPTDLAALTVWIAAAPAELVLNEVIIHSASTSNIVENFTSNSVENDREESPSRSYNV